MKKLIPFAACFIALSLFASCKTLKQVPEDKTSAQIIQMGQNYAGNSEFKSAILCYNTVIDRFGSNPTVYVEAKYELGRIFLTQRKYEKAYSTFTEILEIYDSYSAMLPGTYKKLCLISLDQIPEKQLSEIKAKKSK